MIKTVKRLLIILILALLLVTTLGTAAAQSRGNPRGEINEINETEGYMILNTKDGEIIVLLPEGFDYEPYDAGMIVLVKGTWLSDTEIEAEWVKQVEENAEDQEPQDQDEGEFSSPWCTGQKEGVHPVVAKIAEKYSPKTEVTEEQVHEWFCEGFSLGQIMLALTTNILDGSDPGETLAARKGGKGWGQIWKEKKLIGSESDGYPPGWAHKLNKNGEKSVPPGLLKKTEQAETP